MSVVPYFIFNDIDSRDMGVVVRALPPIVRPTERITQITVPGRHGKLILMEGDEPVYDSFTRTVDCYIRPDVDVQTLLNWLRGSGRVIFSNEPEYAFTARIYSEISLEKIMRGHQHRAFSLSFLCDPCKEQAIPDPAVSMALTDGSNNAVTTGSLYNPGNITAKPLITVTVTGIFTLTVGGQEFTVADTASGSSATIRIDSDAEMVTSSDGTTNLTSYSYGYFPALTPGLNELTWDGDVSELKILPRWRWV